jgi:LuxR family maltose regulon positive regulatory protein
VSRLRARGDILEIGVDDLAMDFPDARALLASVGLNISDSDVQLLLERTEGWPVGLYLAALAIKAGGSPGDAGIAFAGDDRLVADYLRSEVLDHLSGAELAFLTRTAVLERMSPALCDTTLGTSDSDDLLKSLARSNLLLVALDRRGDWYRYHRLFRDLLLVELERREPELIPLLHARAAQWCARHGFPAMAIEHAQAAGDGDLANGLMLAYAVPLNAAGQQTSIRRWFYWFEERGILPRYPAVAVLGGFFFGGTGPPADAERWAFVAEHPSTELLLDDGTTVAERAALDRVLPDGSTLGSWLAILRLLLVRDGIVGARRDVQIALDGLAPTSGFRAVVSATEGICDLLEGDFDGADKKLADAVDLAIATSRTPAAVVASIERALIACERSQWEAAARLADQALAMLDESHLDDSHEASLAHAVTARIALQRGDRRTMDDHLARAARMRPQLTYARPLTSVQTLLQMARVYASLDDVAGAREVLRQAQDILRKRPGLGSLPDQVSEQLAKLDTMSTGVVGPSALTAAEFRLVPFLPTHLTFPQIAERLHVSRNTVKSQAISVYQKLGVSTRADAVVRLGELGLLER